jgi:hypothetical protein
MGRKRLLKDGVDEACNAKLERGDRKSASCSDNGTYVVDGTPEAKCVELTGDGRVGGGATGHNAKARAGVGGAGWGWWVGTGGRFSVAVVFEIGSGRATTFEIPAGIDF